VGDYSRSSLSAGGVEMYVDLGAEKLIAAEKNGKKIAVEIKNFLATSNISEFHTAVGQFLNYRCESLSRLSF